MNKASFLFVLFNYLFTPDRHQNTLFGQHFTTYMEWMMFLSTNKPLA